MKSTKPMHAPEARHDNSSHQKCAFTGSAADFLPSRRELSVLATAAQKCHGCGIYCEATQAVFGEGSPHAQLMLIGEQPGDQEDKAGKPFVGPAGRVLDEALEHAEIPRQDVYVTNAVKHFKWEPRGTRRLHAKPSSREISACRPWLEAEIQVIKPSLIVCLGAVAAQSLLGGKFRLTQHRGEVMDNTAWAPKLLATVHPSMILRIPDPDARHQARGGFLRGFQAHRAASEAEKSGTGGPPVRNIRYGPYGNIFERDITLKRSTNKFKLALGFCISARIGLLLPNATRRSYSHSGFRCPVRPAYCTPGARKGRLQRVGQSNDLRR